MFGSIVHGLVGIMVLLGICYLLSSNRKAIDWKLILGGIGLQFLLAVCILKVGFIYQIFAWISDCFVDLLAFSEEGAKFVFGDWPSDTIVKTTVKDANGHFIQEAYSIGYMFAFKVLPTVVFFSAFSAMLYYLGILQRIIYAIAWVMSKFMNLSGAESMAAAANVFIGQTEAPLVIKPYLEKMSRSEIACLMVGGFSTIAGGVFALFVEIIGENFAIHFLTASIISAPAAIIVAKLMNPEKKNSTIDRSVNVPKDKLGDNLLDAISIGTTDGVRLAVNVGAMLLVIIALVALLNALLNSIGDLTGLSAYIQSSTNGLYQGLSLEFLLGKLFAPIAFVVGVPMEDATLVGQMLGKKMTINEVMAYIDLQTMMNEGKLHQKSIIIATYALCGFANFSSIGIQIGGISAIAPGQRKNLTELGLKAMIGGTIATLLTGAIAGMFYSA